MRRSLWIPFIAVSLLCVYTFTLRAVRLLPLYADASVRADVLDAMHALAATQGWLLSDIELRRVTARDIELRHRPHRRGPDEPRCYRISLTDHSLSPCDAS